MSSLLTELEHRLSSVKSAHLWRQRPVIEAVSNAHTLRISGKHVRCFCSNDYLGLSQHPKLIETAQQAMKAYGCGGRASHLVVGHTQAHDQLEHQLATVTGRDQALVFSSGYQANLAVISTCVTEACTVLEDRLNHASIIDAAILAKGKLSRFLHNDADSLATQLQRINTTCALVAVDGVFSMDGDIINAPSMVPVINAHNSTLMIDDAHGFGCLGANGMGTCDHFDLGQQAVPILVVTFGKALGTMGAAVIGSSTIINALMQLARPYIYTTALAPAIASATTISLAIIREESWRRQNLTGHIRLFNELVSHYQLPIKPMPTPIQTVILGSSERALRWQEHLLDKGFWVSAIRPPTVPQNTARLRITLSADHQPEHIEQLMLSLHHLHTQGH